MGSLPDYLHLLSPNDQAFMSGRFAFNAARRGEAVDVRFDSVPFLEGWLDESEFWRRALSRA